MLLDIRQHLINEGITTPIFIGELPEDQSDVIALYAYSGEPSVIKRIDDIKRPGLQVVVKNSSYPGALAEIENIENILDQTELKINGNYYPWIRAVQNPFPLGRDEQTNNISFTQNYIIHRRI